MTPGGGTAGRRPGWAAPAAVLIAVLATGCGKLPAAAPASLIVVQFSPAGASDQALHRQVRRDCSHLAGVTVVPPTARTVPEYNVIFNVSRADAREEAQLYACLSRQPQVLSVEQQGGIGFG